MVADEAIDNKDIRDRIFEKASLVSVIGAISSESDCIIAGMPHIIQKARDLDLEILYSCEDGSHIAKNEKVFIVRGTAKSIVMLEENIGLLSKSSGVATATNTAVRLADNKVKIVCGAWKKMPPCLKEMLRDAIHIGGGNIRICDEPFVYLDKNYVRIFGGVFQALEAVKHISNRIKVIQIKGFTKNIVSEAEDGIRGGADIIMVDTGSLEDLRLVNSFRKCAGMSQKVKVAFAGNIQLGDLPHIAEEDVAILDIGASIIDAPIIDFRLDVVKVNRSNSVNKEHHANLFKKTEITINDVHLNGVNLDKVSKVAADVLKLSSDEVYVVDVREGVITLDVLREDLPIEDFIDKEKVMLDKLEAIRGVIIGENAFVHSEGILGLIGLGSGVAGESLLKSKKIIEAINKNISKRVKVFSSGSEVQNGMIEDTNSILISSRFEREGYSVSIGKTLDDDEEIIAAELGNAINEGYGVIITTGGVGAEGKDKTIEGVLRVDPTASTEWIVKYTKGTGRHVKDGVRIAVGSIENSRIISLPGPNKEVRAALDVLVSFLPQNPDNHVLASKVSDAIRKLLHS